VGLDECVDFVCMETAVLDRVAEEPTRRGAYRLKNFFVAGMDAQIYDSLLERHQ
jgi:hypothetical protein